MVVKVRELRERLGLSQNEMADKVQISRCLYSLKEENRIDWLAVEIAKIVVATGQIPAAQ